MKTQSKKTANPSATPQVVRSFVNVIVEQQTEMIRVQKHIEEMVTQLNQSVLAIVEPMWEKTFGDRLQGIITTSAGMFSDGWESRYVSIVIDNNPGTPELEAFEAKVNAAAGFPILFYRVDRSPDERERIDRITAELSA